jgi:Flagellar assembly protein FliH
MRWFETLRDTPRTEAEPMTESPRRVKFTNVSRERERLPSWLPSARRRTAKKEDSPLLAPPRVPSEFVDAIRQELEPERASRPPRVSERPRPSARPGSMPPASAAAELVHAPPAAPPFIVDPEATAAFERAVELLISERGRVLEQTAGQLGELATIIARRVIAHEISLNPSLVAGLVREGLEALGAHDRVLVRVGRGFAVARESLGQRLADRGAHAEVRLDATLDEHGCVVETELGSVDESIESRITTLLNALKPDSELPQREDE